MSAPLVDRAGWPTSAHPEQVPGRQPRTLAAGGRSARFPGVPESAARARAFVRLALTGHPGADTAELCVTELIANAIAYTRSGQEGGTVTVTVLVTPAAAVVIVADQGSPEQPLLTGAAASDEHGRGLVLVDALTSDWGTAPAGDGGREVWFRMAGGPR